MFRSVRLLACLAFVILGTACWESPLHLSSIANRDADVAFRGHIPVPHGQAIPSTPVDISVGGTVYQHITVTPAMFDRTEGLYDWYTIDFHQLVPRPLWNRVTYMGQKQWHTSIWARWPVPFIPHNGMLTFFEGSPDYLCFRDHIVSGETYLDAHDACNGNIYAEIYTLQ